MPISAIDVDVTAAVATIAIKPFERTQAEGSKQPGFVDVHTAIAETLERLRWDDEVRIIVITGAEDGEFYWAPGPGVLRRDPHAVHEPGGTPGRAMEPGAGSDPHHRDARADREARDLEAQRPRLVERAVDPVRLATSSSPGRTRSSPRTTSDWAR